MTAAPTLRLAQAARELVQQLPLVAREAFEPLAGNLVEHEVELILGSGGARGGADSRGGDGALDDGRLAFCNDLVDLLPLTGPRRRQRAGNRARSLVGNIGSRRDTLPEPLERMRGGRMEIEPACGKPTQMREVRRSATSHLALTGTTHQRRNSSFGHRTAYASNTPKIAADAPISTLSRAMSKCASHPPSPHNT
jgi:hypothetical protein